MKTRHLAPVLIALLASLLAGCSSGEGNDDSSLLVVATTSILGDVATNVVGDGGTVETLIPIGASPHDYQASSQQAAQLASADLVITNGLHLEEGLEDVIASAIADGANVLTLGPELDPLPFHDADHDDEHDEDAEEHDDEESADEHSHEDGSEDPHVWLDPIRMTAAASLVADRLAEVDSSVDWAANAETYAAELRQANEEIQQLLSTIPATNRSLVTNHDSLGYFAARYDFEIVGVVIPGGSTLADPSSAGLTELVETIEHEGVKAIFGDTTESDAVAEAIAKELGSDFEVIDLYTGSLGEPGSEADSLIGLLVTNARRIAAALG